MNLFVYFYFYLDFLFFLGGETTGGGRGRKGKEGENSV